MNEDANNSASATGASESLETSSVGRPNHVVWGVIVTYHPDQETLVRLLKSIRPQVTELVIVDNGSNFDFLPILGEMSCRLLPLHDNFGIAHAQNVGISLAREEGAHSVLLLDQDSIPAQDMVEHLLQTTIRLQEQGRKVAAVGPRYLDERQGEAAPFVYLRGLALERRACEGPDDVVEAAFLIASGCLMPLRSLDAIGPMANELFIDYVDIEWGLRAARMGYISYGVCAARMQHALGDEWIDFRGRKVPIHSPLRHYYHIRNAIWLGRQEWLSWPWKFVMFRRVILQFVFLSLMTEKRLDHARMMLIGAWHGITNRLGRK
ncbi:glycosyltransferase family 2 protein [Pseudorhizobium flavum]|uniref:glycosyltransferase family 2 protein n=1 Tax=Pseudorhizobium flavum TaxID=1335061 RepID=UPI002492BD0F|nr:glycosyltransferase family 2 protein [Pseudorhizobium flavum]